MVENYTAKILVQAHNPAARDEYRTVNFARLRELATFLYYLTVGVKCTQLDLPGNRRFIVWTGKSTGSYHTRNTKLLTTEICGDRELVDYCLSRHRALYWGMTRARLIINGNTGGLFGTRGQSAWQGHISVQVISAYDFEHARTPRAQLVAAAPPLPAPSIEQCTC